MVTVWRYGKCGNKLLLNCLPAQMYKKIPNVSTITQTRICYSVYWWQFYFVTRLDFRFL
jgi:hypothetical protein